jgi:hypothetical protein
MKARILTYYQAPITGVLLSGAPDTSEAELPDDDYHADDVVEHEGRTFTVIGRKRRGGKLVEVTCRETVAHVPMVVGERAA